MLKVGQLERVEITGYSSEGMGVCRIDGCAVFVPNAIRGEVCEIRVTHVSRNSAHGKIEKILTRSPHRIPRACPEAKRCGGCQLHHMDYAEELNFKAQKVADALTRLGGVDLERSAAPVGGGVPDAPSSVLEKATGNRHQATDISVGTSIACPPSPVPITGAEDINGYRNKAQYPLAEQNGRPVAGFYRNRTHEVVPIRRCGILPEIFDRAKEVVLRWAAEDRVSVYDETTGKGLLRHLYLRKGAVTGQLMVCIVANGDRLPRENRLVHALRRELPGLASVILSVNRRDTNVVLGDECRTLWGRDWIEDVLCGFTFRLSPHSFYQVNHDQAQRLYEKAIEFADLHGTETVLDLYCGTGTITLALSRRGGRAIGVEVVPQAIEDAKENAARNGVENVEFLCADAGEAAKRFAKATGNGQQATAPSAGGGVPDAPGSALTAQQKPGEEKSLPLEGRAVRGTASFYPQLRSSAAEMGSSAQVPPQGADEVFPDDCPSGIDVIVVDPPRKGLAPEVIDAMAAMSPARIVYVSCDPATLARDVKLLTQKGYALTRAEAFDLFPRTFHVETVCLLSKLQSEQKVEIDLDLSELDLTSTESAATYQEIKDYVQENFSFQVTSLQIAQTKRSLGLPVGLNYNPSKKESHHIPQCPPEKTAAIRAALEHFQMV